MEAGIGYAFNNPHFSDRILTIEVEPPESNRTNRPKKKRMTRPSSSTPATTLHVNSLVLASKSAFFYKMFSNGMKESEQQTATLTIKASEEPALLDLLQFMYNNVLKSNTTADLLGVLVVADRYQVVSCVTHCAQTLSSLPMTFELALSCQNLPSTVLEGGNAHLRSLIDAAKCFLSKNFSSHYENALELSLESIENILSWDTLEVDTEDEVYDFVLNWTRTHHKDLKQKRQVFNSRLCHLIRFPYMSCERLKAALNSEELEQGDAVKMVLEALLSKFQNNPTHADATSICQGRVYRWHPVDVTVFDTPFRESIVYWKLKKEECITVTGDAGIYTQDFNVGDESFYLAFSRDGITLYRCTSKPTIYALMVDIEIAVRLKTSGTFTAVKTCACILEKEKDRSYMIGDSWDSLMAEHSRYFYNGVLYMRVTVAINK